MASFKTTLEIGDRAPNFILPARDGENYMFYDRVTGGPIILTFIKGNDFQFDALAALLAADLPDEADWYTIGFMLQEKFVQTKAPPLPSRRIDFTDPRGVVSQAFGLTGEAGILTFILDPNQRVWGIVDDPSPQKHATAVTALLKNSWQRQIATVAVGTAPVILIPNALPHSMCQMLIQRWRDDHNEGQVSGSSASGVYAEKKRSLDHIIEDDQLCHQITQALGRRIMPELHKVFTFDGELTFTRYILAGYTGVRKDFFGLHRDNLTAATQNRRFAVSLNLNDGFEGGCLRFPEYGNLLYHLSPGMACVFSCSLLHEATAVTKGTRVALTTFLCNPTSNRS
ncbi:MAG: 2OG-Fe(II) oxygenase [Alphaproteobacteria bacterium]